MKIQLLTITLLFTTLSFASEPDLEKDRAAIKSFCGCFKVDFNFVETFAPDTNYKIHEPYHSVANAEWAFVETEEDGKISIQHLLIVGPNHVIKHWRQDWIYENQDFYSYNGDLQWTKTSNSAEEEKGRWTQKVYQVDDCIRYESSDNWIHENGKSFWVAETDAPLPRRENTKRSDYNVMHRRNRQEVTDFGWIHEQDNQKIIRKGGQDEILVMEKGYNTYTRIDDSNCKIAQKWWKDNKEYWALVKEVWAEQLAGRSEVKMIDKIDDEKRYERLFELQYAYDPKRSEQIKESVREVIKAYMVAENSSSGKSK